VGTEGGQKDGQQVRSPTFDRSDPNCGGLSVIGNTYKTYQKRLSSPLLEHTQWYNNNPWIKDAEMILQSLCSD
jgi:hypothetical protein